MLRYLLVLFPILVLAGCGSDDFIQPESTVTVMETAVSAITSAPSTATSTLLPTKTANPQPTNTTTPIPTPTLTITPTATLLPLSTHTWDAQPVLVQFQRKVCYDVCLGEKFSALPDLVLYADGRLITDKYLSSLQEFQLQERLLTQTEVCALLNTIDLTGFLEYDPTSYYIQNLNFPRLQTTNHVQVNAWFSNTIDPGSIDDFLPGGMLEGQLEIDPPLQQIYELMMAYKNQPFNPYVPERLIVSLQKLTADVMPGFIGQEQGEWPLTTISLQSLFNQGSSTENPHEVRLIITGLEATQLFELFGTASSPSSRIYTENSQRYEVAVRVLLPYESDGGEVGRLAVIPGSNTPITTTLLTCTPEDGILGLP